MECKGPKSTVFSEVFVVEIDTFWNVKWECSHLQAANVTVEIDTFWNVKGSKWNIALRIADVEIDTFWNVKGFVHLRI